MPIDRSTEGRIKMGAALRSIREAENLSLEEVGARCGVTKSTISKIETGKWNPSADHLSAIADSIGYEWVLKKKRKSSQG